MQFKKLSLPLLAVSKYALCFHKRNIQIQPKLDGASKSKRKSHLRHGSNLGRKVNQLSNGRRFRVLNVVDDHTREMLGQLTDFSISGRQVARFLTQLVEERSKPDQIICDNGTEFTSKAMFFWQQDTGVKLGFIQPGKPTQNAFVESLNGKFRNECLNQHWFRSINEARSIIDQWREHYNHERPHSALNYMTPVAFANRAA